MYIVEADMVATLFFQRDATSGVHRYEILGTLPVLSRAPARCDVEVVPLFQTLDVLLGQTLVAQCHRDHH